MAEAGAQALISTAASAQGAENVDPQQAAEAKGAASTKRRPQSRPSPGPPIRPHKKPAVSGGTQLLLTDPRFVSNKPRVPSAPCPSAAAAQEASAPSFLAASSAEDVAEASTSSAFVALSVDEIADGIAERMTGIDALKLKRCLSRLRSEVEVSALPKDRSLVRELCADFLLENSGATAQRDGGASLSLAGGPISSSTTWALPGDSEMVSDPSEIRETLHNVQDQHAWGAEQRPVLTMQATLIMHGMMQDEVFGSRPLKHVQTMDLLPLHTDGCTTRDGRTKAYNKPRESPKLLKKFAPTTLGIFLGKDRSPVHLIQGSMGWEALQIVVGEDRISAAPDSVYELLGLESAGQAKHANTKSWGLFFINAGEQIVGVIPSLGSGLCGPVSGGGANCVTVATGMVNIIRSFLGFAHVDPCESQLLSCTSGKGRGAAQLQAVAECMQVRGMEGWRHPSQNSCNMLVPTADGGLEKRAAQLGRDSCNMLVPTAAGGTEKQAAKIGRHSVGKWGNKHSLGVDHHGPGTLYFAKKADKAAYRRGKPKEEARPAKQGELVWISCPENHINCGLFGARQYQCGSHRCRKTAKCVFCLKNASACFKDGTCNPWRAQPSFEPPPALRHDSVRGVGSM